MSSFDDQSERDHPDESQSKTIRSYYKECLDRMEDIYSCCKSKAQQEGTLDDLHPGAPVEASGNGPFIQILKRIRDHHFLLEAWGVEVGIKDMRAIHPAHKKTTERASTCLARLASSLNNLFSLCSTATTEDLFRSEDMDDGNYDSEDSYRDSEEPHRDGANTRLDLR
jgi:hypothetical protein